MCTSGMQEYFGATETHIDRYRTVFGAALEGLGDIMFLDAHKAYISCLNPLLRAFLRTV